MAGHSKLSLQPFQAETYPVTDDLVMRIARYSANEAQRKGALQTPNMVPISTATWNGVKTQRLRIGYVSADFRKHPLGYLIHHMFGYHNKELFDVYCYHTFFDDHSPYRSRIKADCEHFKDMYLMNDATVASALNKDKIHIAV